MAKPKCNDKVIAEAVKLKKAGVTNRDIARALGVSETTFYRWVGDPKTDYQRKLSEALKKTETDYKKSLQTIIYNAAVQRDWKAAAWLLERKYPDEYARRERSQVEAKVEEVPRFTFDRGGDDS